MSTAYQSYPTYGKSGVEWVGETPTGWEVQPFFVHASQCKRSNKGMVNDNLLSLSFGRVIRKNIETSEGLLPESFETYQVIEPDDIVFRLTDLQNDKRSLRSALCQELGIITSAYLVARPTEIEAGYLAYLMRSYDLTKVLYALGSGLRQSLKYADMKRLPLLVPSLEEQTQIAKFLDYETAKIDALIEKQQQLITLLKEKRQAVISHAVTQGLNSDAPMRDSGVEWLGEVPAHWEVTRLKYTKSRQRNAFVDGPFGSNLKSEHFLDDGTVFVIESGFATSGELQEEKLKRISEQHFSTIARSEAREGDIIIAKIGARYGMSSILPMLSSKAVVSGNSLKLTVDAETMSVDYAHALLGVLKVCGAMDDNVNVTAQPALSLGGLNNILFLRPPLSEQAAVVRELETRRGKLDDLIASALSLAETLAERRTALISAAVTGKIDVRGWTAPDREAEVA